jgi:hypothetical protein
MEIARNLRDNFSSPKEALLFGRIFLLVTILPLLTRFLTLPRLMKFLTRNKQECAEIGNREDYRNRIVKYTDYLLARNFWIYRKTCLKRSLVLYHFLRPAFPELAICFGVKTRRDPPSDKWKRLDGHSWLIHRGDVFLEEKPDVPRQYIVTYRFPENPSVSYASNKTFTNLSNENRLLLYCNRVGVSETTASELNDLLSGPLNWEFISEAAHSHKIMGLLYHNLKGLSNRSFIPAPAMKDLKKTYHETVARNMFNLAELKTILGAFRRSGLEAIALKGAALMGTVYTDIGLRPMIDIDLLVKEDELEAADRVMTDLGYSAADGLKPKQWYRENHFHLPPYRHTQKPVIVEVHWHVTENSCGDIGKWWKRAVSKDIMGYPILVPSPEDMLIHLSVHLFHHGYNNGFVLRSMCDIFETLHYYGHEIDWKLLQHEIAEQRIEKQVHSMLQLTRRFYSPRDQSFIPIDLRHADRAFLRALQRSIFLDRGDAPINPHLLRSMMLDDFSKKMRYLLPRIFPSRQQMRDRYPAASFPMTMFAYYLVRPFHLLARYGRSASKMYGTGRDGKAWLKGFKNGRE